MKGGNASLPIALSVTALALLFGEIIACSSSAAPTNRLPENLLSAPTDESSMTSST